MVGWAIWGLHGAVVYGTNYNKYRGFPPPRNPKGVHAGRLQSVAFYSKALKERRSYLVYLPPGYSAAAAAGQRFPVMYFLHGSPGKPEIVYNAARIGVEYDVLLHEHRIRPFLMVMPDGRVHGASHSDTEWANTPSGRYGSFVTDVVHAVDARWATIPKRQDRMIAGYSEGAYAALNLSLHQLGTFGTLESWSGYTTQTASGPFAGASPSTIEANEPNMYLPHVKAKLKRLGLRAYLYSGTHEKALDEMTSYSSQLRDAGAHVTFSVFPGYHDWALWRRRTPLMLQWASKAFGG